MMDFFVLFWSFGPNYDFFFLLRKYFLKAYIYDISQASFQQCIWTWFHLKLLPTDQPFPLKLLRPLNLYFEPDR